MFWTTTRTHTRTHTHTYADAEMVDGVISFKCVCVTQRERDLERDVLIHEYDNNMNGKHECV